MAELHIHNKQLNSHEARLENKKKILVSISAAILAYPQDPEKGPAAFPYLTRLPRARTIFLTSHLEELHITHSLSSAQAQTCMYTSN